MRIEITRIWASPSTLHMTCEVWGRDNAWLRFIPVHVPLEQIPSEVRGMILLSEEQDVDETLDIPLDFS